MVTRREVALGGTLSLVFVFAASRAGGAQRGRARRSYGCTLPDDQVDRYYRSGTRTGLYVTGTEPMIQHSDDRDFDRALDGQVSTDGVERAAAEGGFGARTEQMVKAFPGRPRTALLSGIALFHSAGHMGEAATVRSAGGFGTGV